MEERPATAPDRAETIPEVVAMVEKAITENPEISTADLYNQARDLNPAIGDLNRRQFHARYPLQIRRRQSSQAKAQEEEVLGVPTMEAVEASIPNPRRPRRIRAIQAEVVDPKDLLRRKFLEFAGEFAGATNQQETIQVVLGLEQTLDEIVTHFKENRS